MKTLSNNAALSKHITASILGAVHHAIAADQLPSAIGGMRYSLMTDLSHVPKVEQTKLAYILPEYFP